ncbi:hypothetical protein Lesp02_48540 [Lentzea sp. NBRC 105346]|nr:hypothetical protein Lesp02_48540 [Lentzea sp. NBRC 105346]
MIARNSLGLVAGAAIALVGLGVTPAVAATPRPLYCPDNASCVYQNNVTVLVIPGGARPGECFNTDKWVNGMKNNAPQYQRVWSAPNCRGSNQLVSPFSEWTDYNGGIYFSVGGY